MSSLNFHAFEPTRNFDSSSLVLQSEYLSLVVQCMNFACELMDLCRGTQEVEAVLSEGSGCSTETGKRDPLARLKQAIRYREKKVQYIYCILLNLRNFRI